MEAKKRKPIKTTAPGVRAAGNRFQAYCLEKGKFKSIGYRGSLEEAAALRSEYMVANNLTKKPGRPRRSDTMRA